MAASIFQAESLVGTKLPILDVCCPVAVEAKAHCLTRTGRYRGSKITELRASLTPGLRLDHKISCWYGYAPFQSVLSKFKSDLRI